MSLSNNTLKAIAYHEAGHVIAALHLNLPFKYVTINPSKDVLGHVFFGPKVSRLLKKLKESYSEPSGAERLIIQNEIITDFAGFYAERKIKSRSNRIGASQDWHNAVLKAGILHTSDTITEKYLAYCAACAEEIVLEQYKWQQIECIAIELLNRKTLTQKEVLAAIAKIEMS